MDLGKSRGTGQNLPGLFAALVKERGLKSLANGTFLVLKNGTFLVIDLDVILRAHCQRIWDISDKDQNKQC